MIEKIKQYYLYIVIVVVCGLIITGLMMKPEQQDEEFIVKNNQSEQKVETTYIYVDIKGAVENPGVYKVEKGSRLFQVIRMAGGLIAVADDNAINKSIILGDQDVIYIPKIDEEFPNITQQSDEQVGGIININTASISELETLAGIGPTTAQNIIDYRTENGNFETINDLMNVSGIGESTFDKIKEFITT